MDAYLEDVWLVRAGWVDPLDPGGDDEVWHGELDKLEIKVEAVSSGRNTEDAAREVIVTEGVDVEVWDIVWHATTRTLVRGRWDVVAGVSHYHCLGTTSEAECG